ncbi:MAG TPA: hypothetical protein VF147_11910 [Vicinamibacterales bacterium]
MHSTSRRLLYAAAGLLVAASVATATPEGGQDSKSAAAAKELSQLLDAAKLDAVAAADPSTPGAFVAAMYIPGAQLLVVSAKYSAPTLIADRIAKKDYREAYMDLQAASVAGTRVFVQDMLADGLIAKPDGAGDVYEDAKPMTFDGEWKKAKMSEDDYMKRYADADAQYAKMLQVLIAQVKAKAGSGE